MVSEPVIRQAVALLVPAAKAPAKVLLFGSYATGEANEDSDLDFLVIEREVADSGAEMVALRDALRPLRVPADVLVASEAQVQTWGCLSGTVLHEALTDGRVLYDRP